LLITDPEGEMLAAVSPATDQITIWSLSTFHEVGLLDFPGFISPNPVYDAYQIIGAISPDRHYLAVSGCRIAGNPLCLRADLILYDLNSLSTLHAFSGWQRFTRSIAFHPSQEILVFAGEGESVLRGDIILWDINHAKRLAMVDVNEFSNVIEVRYDPTGKYLAVAGSFRDSLREHSKSLQLYDVHSWKITPCELSDQYYASVITFLPGSEMIITGGLGMNFWDLDDCTHRYLNPSLGSSTLEIGVKSDETIIYTMNSSEAAVWAVID
jgi:WD40 repeat protein